MQMRNATSTQVIRLTALFVTSTAALLAQTPSTGTSEVKPELIALNTKATVPYPTVTTESTPTFKTRVPSTDAVASSVEPAPSAEVKAPVAAAPAKSTASVSPAVAAAINGVSTKTSKDNSWFLAGPAALPLAARIDPAFGLPNSQYGAGPTAVRFSFGKK
jgi:hypothetical protein